MARGICEEWCVKRILRELRYHGSAPIKMYCDNKTVVYKPILHDRTKHMDVDKTSSKKRQKVDRCASHVFPQHTRIQHSN